MKKTVVSGKIYLFLFCVILFVAQNGLTQKCAAFKYVDELYALFVIPALLLWLFQKRKVFAWTKRNILFISFFSVFWLCGWGGYFRYHYQPFASAVKDSYLNLKFFMAIGTSFLIFADEAIDFDQWKRKIWPVLNGITGILFVLCLLDLCFGIFSSGQRGGMRAVKLFYDAYTVLVGQCVFLSAIYLWFFEKKQKRILIPLGMLSFVMLSTRRVKAMGAVACIVFIYLLVLHGRKKISRNIKIFAGIIFGVAAAAALYQLVSYYYMMGVESARAVLTIGSPFIAKDHFPFGTGWGTYGSASSMDPYSPVYGMYRMAGVWGLSPDFPDFICDTFWPMVLGQCGLFGFAAFIGALVQFIRKILTLKKDRYAYASALIPLLYLFVSSSSESAFVNPIAIPFAFWFGFLFAEDRIKKDRIEKDREEYSEIESSKDV